MLIVSGILKLDIMWTNSLHERCALQLLPFEYITSIYVASLSMPVPHMTTDSVNSQYGLLLLWKILVDKFSQRSKIS